MEKKDLVSKKIENVVTDAVVNALAEGKGSRAIGTEPGIHVGDTYTILGIDFVSNWFLPDYPDGYQGDKITAEDMASMSDEDKVEAGCKKREWFTFITTNGDLSFGAVMGDVAFGNKDFWKEPAKEKETDPNVVETSEDFNPENIFKPTCRTPRAWIKQGCDDLVGKTIRCVATRPFTKGAFPAKARAFVIESK